MGVAVRPREGHMASLRKSLAQYHRLCNPSGVGEAVAVLNEASALALVREALPSRIREVCEALRDQGEAPATACLPGVSGRLAASNLWIAEGFGLVTQRFIIQASGYRVALWRLSPLGQALMGVKGAVLPRPQDTETWYAQERHVWRALMAHSPQTQAQLSGALGLSASMVYAGVRGLMRRGVVRVVTSQPNRHGHPTRVFGVVEGGDAHRAGPARC